MKLKTILEVCEFLSIKTKDNTEDRFIECASCGETDGDSFTAKTDDGYFVVTNQCANPECGDTTILYTHENGIAE
jgi:ribosomal protein S27AE